MSDSRYTYEEMEIARFTDLPNLSEAFGYEVQARGRWHFLKDAQHIVIKNRTRYFDNYKQEWGDAITFLEDYADMIHSLRDIQHPILIQQASANLKAECRSAQIAHLRIHRFAQRIGQRSALSVFQHEPKLHSQNLPNM